jgi:alkylhydroperoxidase/carboxymuconolactone decarboxylase family protein YurZ
MINGFMALEGLAAEPPWTERPSDVLTRGRALCRRIYGAHYRPMIDRMAKMHPDLARWILREGYGKVLSRRPLPARVREMLTVAILTSQGIEMQLYFHLRGALRLGATRAGIRSMLEACGDLIGAGRVRRALKLLTP